MEESSVMVVPLEVEINVEDIVERWHQQHVRLGVALRIRQQVRLPRQDDFCGWFELDHTSQVETKWTPAIDEYMSRDKSSQHTTNVWSNVLVMPLQVKEVLDRYPFKVYAAQTEISFQSTVCSVGKLRPDIQVNFFPGNTLRWSELLAKAGSGGTRLESLYLVETRPTIEFLWRQGVSSSIRMTLFLASPASTRLARLVCPMAAITTTAAVNVQKWDQDSTTTALLLCATNLVLPDLTAPRQRLREGPNHDDMYVCILFLGLAATALPTTGAAKIGLALLFASFTLPLASLLHYMHILRQVRTQKEYSNLEEDRWLPCDHPKLRTNWSRYIHPITKELCVGLGATIAPSAKFNTLVVLRSKDLGEDPFLRLPENDHSTYARRRRVSSHYDQRRSSPGAGNVSPPAPFDDFDETGLNASASANNQLVKRQKKGYTTLKSPTVEAAEEETQRHVVSFGSPTAPSKTSTSHSRVST